IADSALYAKEDTVFILPSNLEYVITAAPTDKTKQFYQTLKTKFYQKKITKELYDLLFTDPPSNIAVPVPNLDEGEKSESPYLAYEGKIIGNIRVRKINIFGT